MSGPVFKCGSRKYWARVYLLLFFSILFLLVQSEARAQGGAGRQPIRTPTPTPAPTPKPAGGRSNTIVTPIKRDPVPVKRATLTITLPEGSRAWINQIEVEVRDSDRPINVGGQRITTTYSVDQRVLTISGSFSRTDLTLKETS